MTVLFWLLLVIALMLLIGIAFCVAAIATAAPSLSEEDNRFGNFLCGIVAAVFLLLFWVCCKAILVIYPQV